MELLINKVVSSVVEILLFALVPFVWWFITARKKESFGKWIGLKGIAQESRGKVVKTAALVEIGFLLLSFYMLYVVKDVENLATSDFAGMGVSVLPAILVYAIFNTAFPEEILFRGFLLKRLSGKLGFGIANMIQSIIFGLLHGLMFIQYTGVVTGGLIVAFTTAIAWFMGYINEKKANGSILPSWGIHAFANIFSAFVAACNLI